ncbi:MAG TPA: Yip1 family protein [Steroidobacteraceae bacterium]|nr:Yip1 family protein [Steroidobacteraceae bacterium]
MDYSRLIQRVRALLVSPRTEWPVIAAEPVTIADLYRDPIAVLAAIGPVCAFIKTSLIGYGWHGFRVYRLGIGAGLAAAIVSYAVTLVAVYVLAVVIDLLAPSFGGQQNRLQALKVAAWSCTGVWLAGFAHLLPSFSVLLFLAGDAYSVYLLYTGLPALMQVPPERSAAYTAAAAITALVLGWIVSLLTGGITGVRFGLDY